MAKKSRDMAPDGYDKAFNPTKYSKGKNANYDFSKQVNPKTPMGHGSFANMPDGAIMKDFSHDPEYRDGIINSFTSNIEDTSDICENHR